MRWCLIKKNGTHGCRWCCGRGSWGRRRWPAGAAWRRGQSWRRQASRRGPCDHPRARTRCNSTPGETRALRRAWRDWPDVADVISRPPPRGTAAPRAAPPQVQVPATSTVDRGGQCIFLPRSYQVGTKCAAGQKICKNRPTSRPWGNPDGERDAFCFRPALTLF